MKDEERVLQKYLLSADPQQLMNILLAEEKMHKRKKKREKGKEPEKVMEKEKADPPDQDKFMNTIIS